MATLSEVKTNITGKSKKNRFRVTLPTPDGTVSEVLVKASKMPSRGFDVKTISYRGAEIKLAGEPKYEDWSVTMFAESYSEYQRIYNWMNAIGENIDNTRGVPSDYKISSVKVDQIGLDNSVIATIYLDGVWPTNLEEISFDNESSDIVEFDVTFAVDATRFEVA